MRQLVLCFATVSFLFRFACVDALGGLGFEAGVK